MVYKYKYDWTVNELVRSPSLNNLQYNAHVQFWRRWLKNNIFTDEKYIKISISIELNLANMTLRLLWLWLFFIH